MSVFNSVFSDGELEHYIQGNINDPWVGTRFEGYVYMSPKQKGNFGEKFVEKWLTSVGFNVTNAHSGTADYDRIVNNRRLEIKFGLSLRNGLKISRDRFIINHISIGHNDRPWEYLIFVGINEREEDMRFLWFTKGDIISYIENGGPLFSHQQGGAELQNDDYICNNIPRLMEEEWVHYSLETFLQD